MSLDPDAWYRLDTLASNGTHALRLCPNQVLCFSTDTNVTDAAAQWQLLPFGAESASTTTATGTATQSASPSSTSAATTPTISLVSIRNRALGNGSAVGVSGASNITQAVFTTTSNDDPVQLWNFIFLDDGPDGAQIFVINNVANGTRYNLAAPYGETVIMAPRPYFATYDQGWLVSKIQEDQPNASPSPSASGSSSLNEGNSSSHKSSISGGAIAGAVIGAVVGVGLIIGIIVLLLRRRKKQRRPRISNPVLIPQDDPAAAHEKLASPMPKDDEPAPPEVPKVKETVDGRIELPSDPNQTPFSRYELP